MAALTELGSIASSQLPGTASTVLVPLGATEQHGPHLPLDTDTRIATAVTREAAAQLAAETMGPGPAPRWLIAPALGYGASGEHQGFAGTISIGAGALELLLTEYGRSACCWARRVVFVNGHGGNVSALAEAVGQLRYEDRDVCWLPCVALNGDAHAGHTETSLLLHLSPTDVRTDRYRVGSRAPLAELMPSMRRGGVAAVSEVGVLGDPTTATAAEGERIFTEMVGRCVRAIRRWSPTADGMLQ